MRKIGSAPSLLNLSTQSQQDRQDAPQPCLAPRLPTSASGSALASLATASVAKDSTGRRNSVPSRPLDRSVRALPWALSEQGPPRPPDNVTEEFAESAKGLAGLDCFELYGPQSEAPSTTSAAEATAQQQQQWSDESAALASCLATPLTGEDKNLGELVDAEARALLQQAQQGLEAKYAAEVRTSPSSAHQTATPKPEWSLRRKRRLAERFGLVTAGGQADSAAELFEDCPEAQKMLSNMASLDDEVNRAPLGDDEIYSRAQSCFPTNHVDDALFDWNYHPGRHGYKAPRWVPLSHSA